MKSFKQILSEVSRPQSEDEQNFIDKHEVELLNHPVANETQFKSDAKQAKRPADYEEGEDEDVYENVQESTEKRTALITRVFDDLDGRFKKFDGKKTKDVNAVAKFLQTQKIAQPVAMTIAVDYADYRDGNKTKDEAIKSLMKALESRIKKESLDEAGDKVAEGFRNMSGGGFRKSRGNEKDEKDDLPTRTPVKIGEGWPKYDIKSVNTKKVFKTLSAGLNSNDVVGYYETEKSVNVVVKQLGRDHVLKDVIVKWYGKGIKSNDVQIVNKKDGMVELEIRTGLNEDCGCDDKDDDKKLDKFTKAKAKKKFSDLKDKDVDNDGDVDDSDSYLHNRRKKVTKAIKADESVDLDDVEGSEERTKKAKEQLAFNEETFKSGTLKLSDGSSVKVSSADADALTQLLDELSSSNRKKMEDTLLKDKKGYESILTFAKEAL